MLCLMDSQRAVSVFCRLVLKDWFVVHLCDGVGFVRRLQDPVDYGELVSCRHYHSIPGDQSTLKRQYHYFDQGAQRHPRPS